MTCLLYNILYNIIYLYIIYIILYYYYEIELVIQVVYMNALYRVRDVLSGLRPARLLERREAV